MDETGICAQIIFPGVVGLGGQELAEAVQDAALRTLCLEIFNDANAELQAESGNRLLPMAMLPAWDVDVCVREAERAASLGLRGVNLTSDPQDVGAPDLANRAWDPLWEACSSLALPVHFHIGASLTTMNYFGTYPWPSHDDDTKLAIGGTLLFIGNARVVVNIICSGMLDRLPGAEDRVGRERRRMGPVHPRGARLRDVGERARGQGADCRCCRPSTSSGRSTRRRGSNAPTSRELIASVGEDNIMFETDFPHPTCLYPDPLKTAAENMRELSPVRAAQDPRRERHEALPPLILGDARFS